MDCGCGTCKFTYPHMESAKLVVGLDISMNMLKYCSKKISKERFYLIKGDACELPFKPKTFDLIFCIGLLQYVSMQSLFHECKRVLKDDGQIVIVFPNKWNFFNLQWGVFRKMVRTLGKETYSRKEYAYPKVKKCLEHFKFFIKEFACFGMVTYCPLFLQRYVKYLWVLMDKIYAPFQSIFPLGSSIIVVAEKSIGDMQ